MTDTITLTGLVATIPRQLLTGAGLAVTSFRLASTHRRFDRQQNKWIDAETNWYTITTFRQLALNAGASINKGDRVVVTGRLRIRDWQAGDKSGTNIEVDADGLGHDLSWGTAKWVRTTSASQSDAGEFSPAPDPQSSGSGSGSGSHDSEPGEPTDGDWGAQLLDGEPATADGSVATPF